MDELGFVGRCHDHHVGQRGEIGHVEAAGMGRAVGADEPGAVDREADGQVLDRHVVHDLVVGALEEGRVDRAERAHALRGKPGGESHRVLLGDADVEAALGEGGLELVEPGAARHRRGDRADRRVALGLGHQRLGEHVGVARRPPAAALACSPVTTLNFCTPWYLSALFSAGA